MAEYIDREALVRQIICSMTEFVGAPDDVQKHDEQCNYAINMIEDAPAADVAPVVHGRIIESWNTGRSKRKFSCCGTDYTTMTQWMWPKYCPNCGARMDIQNGGDNDEAD